MTAQYVSNYEANRQTISRKSDSGYNSRTWNYLAWPLCPLNKMHDRAKVFKNQYFLRLLCKWRGVNHEKLNADNI
jgi:hypothetical protein